MITPPALAKASLFWGAALAWCAACSGDIGSVASDAAGGSLGQSAGGVGGSPSAAAGESSGDGTEATEGSGDGQGPGGSGSGVDGSGAVEGMSGDGTSAGSGRGPGGGPGDGGASSGGHSGTAGHTGGGGATGQAGATGQSGSGGKTGADGSPGGAQGGGKGGGSSADPYASARKACIDAINAFRATLNLPAYAEWTDKATCPDGQAQKDSVSGTAHSAFGACNESAQDECPAWPSVASITSNDNPFGMSCLQMMWNEGPGSDFSKHGHYINMSSTKYTKVACGFYTTSDGKVWATQDFE